MTVVKRGPVLNDDNTLPERYFPATQKRGTPGGVAGLDAAGRVVDSNGDPVTGGGVSVEELTTVDLPTPASTASGGELVNAEWVRNVRLTIANLPAGSLPFPVKVWDGVQLPRSSYTDRTDIGLLYEMPTPPSTAVGYAIKGLDGWRKRLWVSSE